VPARRLGDVIELRMPAGSFAYGRILRDACVGFYPQLSDTPDPPPTHSCEYAFVVGIEDAVVALARVVSSLGLPSDADGWPPPMSIRDPITGVLGDRQSGAMSL
jgi:hypothetical protein